MIALTKAIGKDVAGTRILVNCIAPAVINTPILGQISQEHIGYMTARIPLGRVGEPNEVASLICWLASEEMSLLDGRVLRHLRRPGHLLSRFVRALTAAGPRVGRLDGDSVDLLDHDDPLAALRGEGNVESTAALDSLRLLPPVDAPEIWCAGVTYERSRDARLEEAETDARDVYALVYDADRPELFLKDAGMRRTVGPGGAIGVRSDSHWTVPEPELGVVIGEDGSPVAVTIGNDVSSRDIEGANPLYIPQAKIFAGACAIGPALCVPSDWDAAFAIRLRITDADGRSSSPARPRPRS